jgi:CBS-domain-containing membrane protein
MDPRVEALGEFSEQGRGVPVQATRPGAALPFSPLVRQAFAPLRRARVGWGQGLLYCADVALDREEPFSVESSLIEAAERFQKEAQGFFPVVRDKRFAGVLWLLDLLHALTVDPERRAQNIQSILSTIIPTCTPKSPLVDALRQMAACYLRRLPVLDDEGRFLGLISLPIVCAAADRDPAVRDVLEGLALSSSLFARPWY